MRNPTYSLNLYADSSCYPHASSLSVLKHRVDGETTTEVKAERNKIKELTELNEGDFLLNVKVVVGISTPEFDKKAAIPYSYRAKLYLGVDKTFQLHCYEYRARGERRIQWPDTIILNGNFNRGLAVVNAIPLIEHLERYGRYWFEENY